jgi:hypothetical protein
LISCLQPFHLTQKRIRIAWRSSRFNDEFHKKIDRRSLFLQDLIFSKAHRVFKYSNDADGLFAEGLDLPPQNQTKQCPQKSKWPIPW